ncbi:MAG: FtsW/RodA/SpoVE family cell cycle protein, partial [Eubacterium sp.]|nr:FtsW/RodA/SpoVE family cell cycle protein [Eubacterium sp.]
MAEILVQISKYIMLALIILFTVNAFLVMFRKDPEARKNHTSTEMTMMIMFDIVAFMILYLQSREFRMLLILGGLLLYIVLIQLLYRLIYKKASLALMNAMCMLLSVGFVIQSRLGTETAWKQLIIVAASSVLCLIIPVFVRKVKVMRNLSWLYAILGILLLGGVFAFGRLTGGANLSVSIAGISFQFSEFVKITFVFFIAAMLKEDTSFRQVIKVSVLAAIHVGILVISRDLGAALIYFVAYIVMVYVSTKNVGYVAIGLGGMALASVVAYRLFAHIRVRVQVWRDPFQDYEGTGYQIVQALFGVCAGGWFGTGLFDGNPEMIPLAKEDFTYAAICEEFGILFGIFLILLCMIMYLQIVSISTKLSNRFYRLVAIGLGTEYAFQVFLTVGGTTKFIPMTGITLPLVSYGGSSIMCTIIMLSIIQGLYMIREDEGEEKELLQAIIDRQNEKEEELNLRRRAGAEGGTGPVPGRTPRRQRRSRSRVPDPE